MSVKLTVVSDTDSEPPSPFFIDVMLEGESWSDALPDAERLCQKAAASVLREHRLHRLAPGLELTIVLSDNTRVQELNARFRDKDKPTNVLSFPSVFLKPDNLEALRQDAERLQGTMLLGDVILADGVVQAEAKAQGKELADHVQHLVVHAVLHLLGYDHIDAADATQMESKEIQILKGLGVPNPYEIVE